MSVFHIVTYLIESLDFNKKILENLGFFAYIILNLLPIFSIMLIALSKCAFS